MSVEVVAWIFVFVAMVSANLPWLSKRGLFFFKPKAGHKTFWLCLLEWCLLYLLNGILAISLEQKVTGQIFSQGWEFYLISMCLFLLFALPGFVVKYQLQS